MSAALLSNIMLWLVVAFLAVLVAALARQVGILHERIAPAGALSLQQQLKVGERAPTLVVSALDGQNVAIGGKRATSQLLFFVSPDCPVCKSLLPVFKSIAREYRGHVEAILASDGDDAEHRRFAISTGLAEFPYVLSERLGRTYGVSKLPYAFLIDEEGVLSSHGLVNSREHLESLFEAQKLGVASIQQFLARG
jgi:methylamine dehydrogenase accessory protein MauD